MPSAASVVWSTEPVGARGHRHRLTRGRKGVSWRAFTRYLVEEPAFRASLADLLAASEHPAIYWETSPVSATTVERPFEMVVLPATRLVHIEPDAKPFEEHLESSTRPVCTFPSLRGDARLVVPRALGLPEHYGHLAAFLRGAPASQIDALWQAVGEEIDQWWATHGLPVWVSTAGGGVPWLHVRLDRRPKYYKHRAYCEHHL